MDDLSLLHSILRQSTELWGKGMHEEALKLLDENIVDATTESNKRWIRALSTQGSHIAEEKGDHALAQKYSEQALSTEPDIPLRRALVLYTLANSLFRQGDKDLGKRRAAECYELVFNPKNQEERGMLVLLKKKWPEIGEWKK